MLEEGFERVGHVWQIVEYMERYRGTADDSRHLRHRDPIVRVLSRRGGDLSIRSLCPVHTAPCNVAPKGRLHLHSPHSTAPHLPISRLFRSSNNLRQDFPIETETQHGRFDQSKLKLSQPLGNVGEVEMSWPSENEQNNRNWY